MIVAEVRNYVGENGSASSGGGTSTWPNIVSGGTAERPIFIFNFDPAEQLAEIGSLQFASLACNIIVTLSYEDVFGDKHVTESRFNAAFDGPGDLNKGKTFQHPL